MPQRELDHLSDLSHLSSAPSDIVITDIICLLLILPLHRLSLTVYICVRRTYTVGGRIHLHHLELYRVHGCTDKEEVTLA